MKTIIKIFAAVLTAVPVLVSCYSEPLPEVIPEVIPEDEGNGSEQDSAVRVITLSFDTKATRTVLGGDGKKPKFSDGDKIAVASITAQTDTQHCKVSVNEKGIATTTTTLTGELKAVYPASCVLINDNDELTYMVPYTQTGKFADANICTATIPDGEHPTAVFTNRTAIFRIKAPENMSAIAVAALDLIDEDTGQRSGDSGRSYIQYDSQGFWYRFDVNGKDDDGFCYISVLAEDTIEEYDEDDECIYAVLAGDAPEEDYSDENKIITPKVLLRDLCFDVYIDYGTGYMGGFSPKFLNYNNLDPETATVQAGAMYTGVENHLHKYNYPPIYTYGTDDLFVWAEDDLKTEGGDFFMWGEVDGHSYDDDSWTNFENGDTNGFATQNLPTLSKTYSKDDVLQLDDDAVYQNWGGPWRMPTYSEFNKFNSKANAATETFSDYSYVMGTGAPSEAEEKSDIRFYWTSEKGSDNNSIAYPYYFNGEHDKYPKGYLYTGNTENERPSYYGIRIKGLAKYIEK